MNRYELMRYEKGYTRPEVVEATGVSERTLRYIENDGGKPSAPVAKKLADFYKVTVAELMGVTPGDAQKEAA